MAAPPDSTTKWLRQRLNTHAQARWPQVTSLDARYHGAGIGSDRRHAEAARSWVSYTMIAGVDPGSGPDRNR